MNRLIIFEAEREKNNVFCITEKKRLEHLYSYLRPQAGEYLKVCLLGKGLGDAKVLSLDKKKIKLEIQAIGLGTLPWVDLLIGLSRPQTCKKVLEQATSLGAQSFHFFKATLSEKSYASAKLYQDKNFEEHLLSGISQGAIYHQLPSVKVSSYFPKDFNSITSQKFVLHPGKGKFFCDYKIDFSTPLTLAIGPERGFTSQEVSQLIESGFQEVSLGPSVMRVETAIVAALGQLELLRKMSK